MKSHEEVFVSLFKFAVVVLLVTTILFRFYFIDTIQYFVINIMDSIMLTIVAFGLSRKKGDG